MRKDYIRPQVTKVALVPEEAVLTACKGSTAETFIPGTYGPGDPWCDSSWGVCYELGS